MEKNKIYQGNAIDVLKNFEDNSIDCCVTSPPYYALRDYGVDGQIGLEEAPEKYIERLTEVFMEVHRVLKPEGTLWLNIGDSYNGYKGNASNDNFETEYAGHRNQPARTSRFGLEAKNIKPKDLIGIPWMLAFSLRNAGGWYLRQDIIWEKRNPMPESVKDRCTKSHEYIFLMSKSQKYYFDFEAIQEGSIDNIGKRNKRDVWSVSVKPFKEAHFATYPQELIAPCILAGCPQGGVVLDPFMGSGTTAIVASKLGRDYVGIELNPEYKEMAERRIKLQKTNLTLF